MSAKSKTQKKNLCPKSSILCIKEHFIEKASSCLATFSESQATPCPDQYVGKISSFDEKNDFVTREDPLRMEMRNPVECIILVLESPHKDELKDTVAPAKGSTGKLIRKYALEVLSHISSVKKKNSYGLILVNAVQFQCSLGLPTRYYRDEIFLSAWEHGGRENFIERLTAIHKKGDIVVNACTMGNFNLKDKVSCAICEAIGCSSFYEAKHPSSWFSSKNRTISCKN